MLQGYWKDRGTHPKYPLHHAPSNNPRATLPCFTPPSLVQPPAGPARRKNKRKQPQTPRGSWKSSFPYQASIPQTWASPTKPTKKSQQYAGNKARLRRDIGVPRACVSLWLLTQAFQTGNPLCEGLGRRGSYNCLPEHKTGDRAVKNNIGTERDFPSTQGISTQSRGAVATRMSLLGISNPKDQKHISKRQTTLICTTCQPGLGSSSHLRRGQTPSSCTLLHPTARENENGFAGTFASSFFFFFLFGVFFFFFASFYDYSIFSY